MQCCVRLSSCSRWASGSEVRAASGNTLKSYCGVRLVSVWESVLFSPLLVFMACCYFCPVLLCRQVTGLVGFTEHLCSCCFQPWCGHCCHQTFKHHASQYSNTSVTPNNDIRLSHDRVSLSEDLVHSLTSTPLHMCGYECYEESYCLSLS